MKSSCSSVCSSKHGQYTRTNMGLRCWCYSFVTVCFSFLGQSFYYIPLHISIDMCRCHTAPSLLSLRTAWFFSLLLDPLCKLALGGNMQYLAQWAVVCFSTCLRRARTGERRY
ncbi:hypothetical protein JB92DRAFT_813437 [Gautieria morchelliformis]|nr:hypothetical protein JB92DRAFT_813437 [Gautieria morchelliformis]